MRVVRSFSGLEFVTILSPPCDVPFAGSLVGSRRVQVRDLRL